MSFKKVMLLGTLLAATVPAAMATPILYGDLSGAGKGIISSTAIKFSNINTVVPKLPKGVVIDGTAGFSNFTFGTPLFYDFFSPNTFTFASATATTPVLFLTIHQGSNILNLYLTNIDAGNVVGSPFTTGGFTGEGYVTDTGFAQTPVTFELTNIGKGAGEKAFTFDIVAATPEPSSLVLLGTGVMGAAGIFLRRRQTV